MYLSELFCDIPRNLSLTYGLLMYSQEVKEHYRVENYACISLYAIQFDML